MIFATDDIAPVLERTVQWDSLLASRLVTEADVKVIRGYDDQGPLAPRAFLEQVRVEPTDDAAPSPTRACRARTSGDADLARPLTLPRPRARVSFLPSMCRPVRSPAQISRRRS